MKRNRIISMAVLTLFFVGGGGAVGTAAASTSSTAAPAQQALGASGGQPDDPPVSPTVRDILAADPAEYATLPVLDAPGYEFEGRIKPRSTAELLAAGLTNDLMIGGETTDRNFSTFSNWREYLNPLGVTKLRIQSGWQDVEKVITTPSTYDFAKLDEIVNGAVEQNVRPFIFLGYGNNRPGCVDCGTPGLGGAFPKGEGKERFLKFVEATVARYKDKVNDWQIWNEPTKDLETYKTLIVDVAKLIKRVQPTAKITIGSWYTVHYVLSCLENCNDSLQNQADREYILSSLKYFYDNKGPTVPSEDVYVAFHPYALGVDYDRLPQDELSMDNFLSLVRGYGFTPRMDENGAPSTPCQVYAMCNGGTLAWNEPNQAKYNLRRVIGDLARGIETSMFTITDLHYDNAKNTKGLLSTGEWNPNLDTPFNNGDQTVKGKKIAYVAYQNVTALFDDRMVPLPQHGCVAPPEYAVHAWTWNDKGKPRTVIAAWKKSLLPEASLERTMIRVECSGLSLNRPATPGHAPYYVDMMDGRAYRMPLDSIEENDVKQNHLVLTLPVGDWPALVADPAIVREALASHSH